MIYNIFLLWGQSMFISFIETFFNTKIARFDIKRFKMDSIFQNVPHSQISPSWQGLE